MSRKENVAYATGLYKGIFSILIVLSFASTGHDMGFPSGLLITISGLLVCAWFFTSSYIHHFFYNFATRVVK